MADGQRGCPLPTASMFLVEFPGIVINDAAALATFGGAAGVAAAALGYLLAG